MAAQGIGMLVPRERDIAVATFRFPRTRFAGINGRKAASVLEQNRLLARRQSRLQTIHQRRGKMALHRLLLSLLDEVN